MIGCRTENLANRRFFIGGSDARMIMGGDESALMRLWREKRGEVETPDLSGELIVQLGLATEDLNRRWYERTSGYKVGSVQRRAFHRTFTWMAATLDGLVEETGTRRPQSSPKTFSIASDSVMSFACVAVP